MEAIQQQTFLTEGKPPPEELVDDDLGDLEALVSGVTQTSQSTLLLKKRKEMREVDDALEFMKEQYDARMADCRRGQLEFEKKQVEMKKMVSKFEKFIQENDAKKRRAEMKENAEIQMRHDCEIKIQALRKKEAAFKAERALLKERLEEVQKYEMYLAKVVDALDDGYEEISDVTMRHKTLKDAHTDLGEQSQKNNTSIEATRLKLVSLRQEQQNKILVMNGEVQDDQKLIESLRVKCSTLAIDKESKERFAKDRTMQYGAVVMSIKNLYHRCHSSYMNNTRPAAVKEKGVPLLHYLNACLESVSLRIQNLRITSEDFPAWKLSAERGDEAAPATSKPPKSTAAGGHDKRKAGGGSSSRPRGGRGSTTSGSSHRGGGAARAASSDVSAVGFHPEDSSASRQRRGGHRRGSDMSSTGK